MKFYFDNIVFYLQNSGGISIVWYELIRRLLVSDLSKNTFFLEYAKASNNIFRVRLKLPQIGLVNQRFFCLCLQRYLNPIIKDKERFIFHSSYYRTCSNKNAINITTVHDFTYEYFVHGLKKYIHCWQKYRAIMASDYIICVSESTKKDLLKFLPNVNIDRIKVIYNGVSEEYLQLTTYNEQDLPYKIQTYVLFVGSRASYKNFKLSVLALRESKLNLVIVGNELSNDELVFLEDNLRGRYCYAGRISNERLNLYYNGAFCLLYPSSYEGFGIPVLEAQKAGCPVIAANSSSIPEVIGDSSILLSELTINEIQRKISQLYIEEYRRHIIQCGLENAKRFAWDRMYAQIEELYKSVLNNERCES